LEIVVELHQVAQHADDLDRAVSFYTGMLGGELIAMVDPPGLAFVRLGSARLLLDRAAPSALLYYLRVEDVRTTTADLASQGVAVETEPHRIHVDSDGTFGEPGWEEWMAFIQDTEGNILGLASRHAPAI
jgi:methylmalonyl-CoA/ethylmalonyl-CoA epimerase